jgi:hypothetical protein
VHAGLAQAEQRVQQPALLPLAQRPVGGGGGGGGAVGGQRGRGERGARGGQALCVLVRVKVALDGGELDGRQVAGLVLHVHKAFLCIVLAYLEQRLVGLVDRDGGGHERSS